MDGAKAVRGAGTGSVVWEVVDVMGKRYYAV
jgi:hypothetical protein